MNLLNLVGALIFLGNGFYWLRRGWKIRRGQKAYKPWLNPQDPLNKRVGTYSILAGIAVLGGSFPFLANLTIVSTSQKQILLPLACLSIPLSIITGGLYYELKLRIERIEPKVAENKERA